MEIEEYVDSNTIQRWGLENLRSVRYEPTVTTVFARSSTLLQRIYPLDTDTQSGLGIRRVVGLPYKSALSNLIWLRAHSENSASIRIGVESSYVFERTGCLLTSRIVAWGHAEIAPVLEILGATLLELESLLNLQIEGFLEEEDIPALSPANYIAVDHQKECKVLVLASDITLDSIESQVRHYCLSYWKDHELMGQKIHLELGIYINPFKRLWRSSELASFELGDLVAIQNYTSSATSRQLRGSLRLRGHQSVNSRYEVFMEMSENDTRLHFGSDTFDEPESIPEESPIAPHEQIELEIQAGKTKILFNDLCSVQAGTLIELREHALPMVTLCVMGSPILEGELVHFQDQLMVQVTKRLD